MDSKGEMMPKAETIAPEIPRNDSSNLVIGPPGYSPVSGGGIPSLAVKKKRGRPRKYGPDGAVAAGGTASGGGGHTLSPIPISASGPPAGYSEMKLGEGEGSGGRFLDDKKKKMKMSFSESKTKRSYGSVDLGQKISSGGSFTPHMVTVNPGEDVTSKIISFTKDGPRSICVLSAIGVVSHATLSHPSSSGGGTVTYEGRFEILSLSGSFTPTEEAGGGLSPESKMSVALSSPDGRVVGGQLGGLLTAASPVQVVVASFLPSLGNSTEPSQRKQKGVVKLPTQTEPFAIVEHQNLNEHAHESLATRNTDSTPDTRNFQNINEHLHESSATRSTLTRNFPNFNENMHESPPSRNTRIFKLENQTSASVHDWRRTDMNVSLNED